MYRHSYHIFLKEKIVKIFAKNPNLTYLRVR